MIETVVLIAASALVVFLLRLHYKDLVRALDDNRWEISRIPYDLERRAREIYGSGRASFDRALECHDAHMPGDCPLCGADEEPQND